MTIRRWAPMLAVAGLVACSGGGSDEAAETPAAAPAPAPAPASTSPQAEAVTMSGEIDQGLATQGEALFQAKACVGCHTVGGGRLTGPDLARVADRRSPEWLIAMIVAPDSMLRDDETARQLLAEYATPMANMNVSRDEARAILEYLRRASP